jgi:hypothetical protein
MFNLGIMGGFYFKLPTKLPDEFLKELGRDPNVSNAEIAENNCYKVLCGASLEWWQMKGLMHPDDPNGWIEWYVKFYYGRRHFDDNRQIKRFNSFVARHMGLLNKFKKTGKEYPIMYQNLLQWAWFHGHQPV